jgi:hypothetical protein
MSKLAQTGKKQTRWGKHDCELMDKAIVQGILTMEMGGGAALDALQNSSDPGLQSIGNRYTTTQILNRLKTIRSGSETVEELHGKTVNKMSIENDLHRKYGKYFLYRLTCLIIVF